MIKIFIAISFLFYSVFVMASPKIIAHRGGTADAPENTEIAIKTALSNQADAIWITVQLSKDNVPVLYRPSDLKSSLMGKGQFQPLLPKNWRNGMQDINMGKHNNFHIAIKELLSRHWSIF